MWPLPGGVLGKEDVARVETDDGSVADLDFALPRQRDDVLAARRRVPVDEVVTRSAAELDAGDVDGIRELGGAALRVERDVVLLGVRLAVVAGVDAGDADRSAFLRL